MILIRNMIIGFLANRLRGMNVKILFLSQDDINALLFAAVFSKEWWNLPVLYLAMKFGSATGWTEGICGCFNKFELAYHEDRNWISKIFFPTNQWNTFGYMLVRALIWVLPLQLGLWICGIYADLLWLAIPLFYFSYRIPYLIFKDKQDNWAIGEVIFGVILWGACSLCV